MEKEYLRVNVFTETKNGGNPLPVILDARGLGADEMQQIARCFRCSETTFILPPKDPSHTARVRIFTPERELPFAGHPNVGTAYVVGSQATVIGDRIGGAIAFEEISGIVEAKLIKQKKKVTGARIKAPAPLHISEEKIDPVLLAASLSLNPNQIIIGNHQPVFADVGLQFLFAELENLHALKAARINFGAYKKLTERYPQKDGRLSIFVYMRDGESYTHLRARMHSTPDREDPATGSACAAVGGLLATIDPRCNLTARIEVVQGVEMGCPSLINLEMRKAKGIVGPVWVGGQCVPIERGTIDRNGQILTSHSL